MKTMASWWMKPKQMDEVNKRVPTKSSLIDHEREILFVHLVKSNKGRESQEKKNK